MVRFIKKIPVFFKEVREEFKKVNWTSRQELTGAAIMVVIVSLLLTVYIFLIDLGLSKLVKMLVG